MKRTPPGCHAIALLFLVLWMASSLVPSRADEPAVPSNSPRLTPTAKLIRRSLPAVVALRAFRPTEKKGVFHVSTGSGSVVHPAGYIVTNDHVVSGAVQGFAMFADNRTLPFKVIAGFAHEDIAVIKVDPPQPLTALRLGRSHDLILGEPVIAIGTPSGLAHTASDGIVSGIGRNLATPHGVIQMLQTNAAISGGSSGGPLINALGEQIGMITSQNRDGENLGFAVPADRIRAVFETMLVPEQRNEFHLGARFDVLASKAEIVAVEPSSPAAKSGLKVGDVVLQLDGTDVERGYTPLLSMLSYRAGRTVTLRVRRGDEEKTFSLLLEKLALPQPVAGEGLRNGLSRSVYLGEWDALPDFHKLKPHAKTIVAKPNAQPPAERTDLFGLRYDGFVKVTRDGLYAFGTESDDGSRLWVSNQQVVSNDGLHASRQAMGLIRLTAGLHPVTIDFFEQRGDEVLRVFYEGPGIKKQEIPADAYFVRPPAKTLR